MFIREKPVLKLYETYFNICSHLNAVYIEICKRQIGGTEDAHNYSVLFECFLIIVKADGVSANCNLCLNNHCYFK